MRSAARNALSEALLWLSALLAAGAFVYFFDDIVAAARLATSNSSAVSATVDQATSTKATAPGFEREVRLRANDSGHFVFKASIDGRPVTFMADTGATMVVLTFDDAERLGLSPQSLEFSGRAQTANGVSRMAPVTLDRVEINDITLRDVPAAVAEQGALGINLLGMSFLSKLTRFEMQGSELVLVQ